MSLGTKSSSSPVPTRASARPPRSGWPQKAPRSSAPTCSTARKTLGIIADAGGTVEAVQLDVRQSGSWAEVVAGVIDRHGRVDCLANVAGVVNMISEDSVVGLTEEAWDNVVGTDLKGVWLGMRAVIPTMIANGGGRIVNISSMAALRGLPNLASYSAARAELSVSPDRPRSSTARRTSSSTRSPGHDRHPDPLISPTRCGRRMRQRPYRAETRPAERDRLDGRLSHA